MGWLVHARLGAGVLQRTSCVYPHHTGPRASDRPRRLPQRLQSPLWRPGCAHWVAQAGAKWGRISKTTSTGRYTLPFGMEGPLNRKGCEWRRNKAKRACLQIATNSQPGGGVGWEIGNPTNFQGLPHPCDHKLVGPGRSYDIGGVSYDIV